MFKTFNARISSGIRNGEARAGMVIVAAIKKGIQSQSPGGSKFTGLHPYTIATKGSTKALVDKGTLLRSITWKRVQDFVIFVGVLRKAKNRDGVPLVNLAKMLEEGATLDVTPEMRAYLASNGFILKPSTTTLHIPPRPFIKPVLRNPKIMEQAMTALNSGISEALMI
jgi:hypothetical protein